MFDIVRIKEELNLFIVIKKDALSESGGFYKNLPIEVYGFLSVDGDSYETSHVSYKNISDELSANGLDEITELAKLKFFEIS